MDPATQQRTENARRYNSFPHNHNRAQHHMQWCGAETKPRKIPEVTPLCFFLGCISITCSLKHNGVPKGGVQFLNSCWETIWAPMWSSIDNHKLGDMQLADVQACCQPSSAAHCDGFAGQTQPPMGPPWPVHWEHLITIVTVQRWKLMSLKHTANTVAFSACFKNFYSVIHLGKIICWYSHGLPFLQPNQRPRRQVFRVMREGLHTTVGNLGVQNESIILIILRDCKQPNTFI